MRLCSGVLEDLSQSTAGLWVKPRVRSLHKAAVLTLNTAGWQRHRGGCHGSQMCWESKQGLCQTLRAAEATEQH